MLMFLQLTLLTLYIASPSSLIHADNVITCGGNVQRLACARGVINVQSSFYGRTSAAICRANQHPRQYANIWCYSSVRAVRTRCNGRRVCEFNGNIVGRFDPCPGTSKYFSTTYTCVTRGPRRRSGCSARIVRRRTRFYRTASVCDNSYKTISCGRNTIKIYNAIYGRSDRTTCARGLLPWYTQNTRCHANARSRVASVCDGRHACTVFSSNFPNYCPGTAKYLKVSYNCVVKKEVVACEHSNAVLTCGRRRRIRVFNANYGRTDYRTCTRGRSFFFSWFYNTRCYQRNSTFRVINRCNGRRACVVPATNYFFSDPCYGTYKYLRVSYACE